MASKDAVLTWRIFLSSPSKNFYNTMTSDIRYTQEVEPIIRAYDKIFDLLCFVWSGEYKNPVELNWPDEKNPHYGEWLPIIKAYEELDFERLQSAILPKELQYLVPRKKETSKLILDRRALTGARF